MSFSSSRMLPVDSNSSFRMVSSILCVGGFKIPLAICTVNIHATYGLKNMGTCVYANVCTILTNSNYLGRLVTKLHYYNSCMCRQALLSSYYPTLSSFLALLMLTISSFLCFSRSGRSSLTTSLRMCGCVRGEGVCEGGRCI